VVRRDIVLRLEAIEKAKAEPWASLSPRIVDPVVQASWQRCAPVLDACRSTAPVDPAEETRERWDASPIRRAVPGLVARLEDAARDSDLAAAIADADGRVLWQYIPRWLRSRGEAIGFTPGGVWHEVTSGTNGVGLALAADRPVTVFATEHWLSPVAEWVCYAAPVHDVDGTQIGAIDLSVTYRHANPLGQATVASMAGLVEHELRARDRLPRELIGPRLDLRVLGEPVALLDGRRLRLTLRQYEILTTLALGGPSTLERLHARLYGDRRVSIATLKAEISHLRRSLDGRLESRPYRLTLPVRLDATEAHDRLAVGDVEGAARLYDGQLLGTSESPFLVDERHRLDVALRIALLAHAPTGAVHRYAAVHPYDTEVLERAIRQAATDDPLVPGIVARLAVANQRG
jgi:hypothetical protein